MTDPKTLQGLARIVRDPWLNLANCQKEQVATALDCYARILAASPDVREIEERNQSAIAEVEALDPLAGIVVTRAQKDCATLLDVVRRKDAEIADLTDSARGLRLMLLGSQDELAEARTVLAEELERHAGTKIELRAEIARQMEASETWLHSSRQALIAFEKVKERADRLEDGVRTYRQLRLVYAGSSLCLVGQQRDKEVTEWEREHGAMVAGDGGKES